MLYKIPNTLQGAYLTTLVMEMDNSYQHLGKLGLFEDMFSDSKDIAFSHASMSRAYIECSDPCNDGVYVNHEVQSNVTNPDIVRACHRMVPIEIHACHLNGFRTWDCSAWETVAGKAAQDLEMARADLDYSMEVDMMNSILGRYADGGTYSDISGVFGADFSLSTETVDLSAVNLQTWMSGVVQSTVSKMRPFGKFANKYMVLLDDAKWNELAGNPEFNPTQNANMCCNKSQIFVDAFGQTREIDNFIFVNFASYGLASLPTASGLVVPLGVKGMLQRWWTPANVMGKISRIGDPVTVTSHLLSNERGLRLEVHTDPLVMNRYPQFITQIT